MNLLKKLPWLTILIVVVVVLKFYPKIMDTLRAKAPSLANALDSQTITSDGNPVV